MFESRLNVLAHQGNDDEDAEETVNHAGNGGEKINKKFEGVGNSGGSELGQKNRGADAERDGDEKRDGGGDESAVNKRQGAELIEDGIPDGGAEEIESKLVAGDNGTPPTKQKKEGGGKKQKTSEQKKEKAWPFTLPPGARQKTYARPPPAPPPHLSQP